jgi:hypothetical protein
VGAFTWQALLDVHVKIVSLGHIELHDVGLPCVELAGQLDRPDAVEPGPLGLDVVPARAARRAQDIARDVDERVNFVAGFVRQGAISADFDDLLGEACVNFRLQQKAWIAGADAAGTREGLPIQRHVHFAEGLGVGA